MYEEFLNIFGNSLQFGFIYFNKDGLIEFVNKSFLALSQLEKIDLINKNWTEIIAEEDRRWVEEFFRENRGRSFFLDFRIKKNYLPVRCFFSSVTKEKELLGYSLTFFAFEKELSKETAIPVDACHEIMENAIDGICILKDKNIVLANRRLEELTGYSKEELKKMDILELIVSPDKSKIASMIEKPDTVFSPLHFGVKIINKNKFEVDAELRIVPIVKNGTESLIFFFRDITYLKELEKLKTDYFAMVSHELRNPLVTIKEASSILYEMAKDKLPKEGEKFFNILFEEIIRLFHLIDNLIEVSRLESGKIKLNFQSIDIQQLVEKAIKRFNIFLDRKNINIEKIYPSPPLRIEIDPDRFFSVITNLLDNAIKYSPENSKIKIQIRKIEANSTILKEKKIKPTIPYVLMEITNEGPSIPKEYQERIFEKFERLELKAGVKGVGLGLAIVKNIVKLHKGEIWVESEERKGTTFYVLLPLTQK